MKMDGAAVAMFLQDTFVSMNAFNYHKEHGLQCWKEWKNCSRVLPPTLLFEWLLPHCNSKGHGVDRLH